MARKVSDYQIRVPESTEPGACLEYVKCLKIASAPENPRGTKEQFWCFDNGQWRIYTESEPPPPTQTITLQGAEDSTLASGVIEELLQLGCPFPIQAVIICADNTYEEVRTFPGVSLNGKTPDGGYGFGVPGVDTGSPPPSTITVDGTWFGNAVTSKLLVTGPVTEDSAPDIVDAPLADLFFCDAPTCGITGCGDANPSNGCRTAFAIFDDGTNPIIAEYHVSGGGAVTLVSQETLPNSNGLVAGACLGNRVVVTDGTCIYTACGGSGLTKVVLPDEVPAGSIKDIATAQGSTDHIYALFSTSGVLHSRNGRTWEVVLDDNFFPGIAQQNGITAVGDVVVTYGEDASLQVNTSGGDGTWYNRTVNTAGANDPVLGVALDLPNPFNKRYAYMYALTDSGTQLTVHFSGNDGATWEARRTFTATVLNPESVTIAASVGGSRVYLSWDSVLWVNFNHACECDWVNLSPDFACGSTKMAVCSYDPNRVFILGDGVCGAFARNDVAETESSTPATPVVVDILANDRAASGETLDVATLDWLAAPPALPANVQSITANPTTGALTVTPDDGFSGVITFTYNIDDTAANSTSATVKIIVGDVDASLLVC